MKHSARVMSHPKASGAAKGAVIGSGHSRREERRTERKKKYIKGTGVRLFNHLTLDVG